MAGEPWGPFDEHQMRQEWSRRRILQSALATAGLAAPGMGAAACAGSSKQAATTTARATTTTVRKTAVVLPPGTRPFPDKPEGTESMPEIEHIVIYMQEHHSFDNYYGMLGRGDGFTIRNGVPTNTNPGLDGTPVPLFHMPETCDHTTSANQNWSGTLASVNGGKMDGFVRAANGATGSMGYWDDSDIPFYWSLAKTFPLCDRWFCSAPAQTLPNRRFFQAATSMGILTSDVNEVLATPDAPNGTIWDRLNTHGISWATYAVDLADIMVFPKFYAAHTDHVKTFDQFLADAAAGTLPQVCSIAPGHKIYTEENPWDIRLGEAYSASIINAVMQGKGWEKTALFFVYDEHGGYYDHVPPPAAIPPDDIALRLAAGDPAGKFDVYGPRVPAHIISPYAKRDHVSHVVHDHTSMLKFIETKFNLGAMTYRDANADDLLDSFDFTKMAFREPPTLAAPGLPATGSTCEPEVAAPKQPLTPA